MIAQDKELTPGLYLVATPIGNARDITLRALDVLAGAEILAAEDTRTLRKLLEIHGIGVGSRQIIAYHDHSKETVRSRILDAISGGASVAYASEAGTPLIADPGYRLALNATEAGLKVIPVPGPSAALAALAIAGLPSDIFTFAGFAPTADGARRSFLEGFTGAKGSLIFYESPKRVQKFLSAAADVLGADRSAVIARELTKKFEETRRGTLDSLSRDPGTLKGEIVIVIGPSSGNRDVSEADIDAALTSALRDNSVKDAAAIVADQLGLRKRDVYQKAISLKS